MPNDVIGCPLGCYRYFHDGPGTYTFQYAAASGIMPGGGLLYYTEMALP